MFLNDILTLGLGLLDAKGQSAHLFKLLPFPILWIIIT